MIARLAAACVATVMFTGAAQAQDTAALRQAIAALQPLRQACYDGVGTADTAAEITRARAAAIAGCDAYAAGVSQVIEDLDVAEGQEAHILPLVADAMRVKGELQIDGGDAEMGLRTLTAEVMILSRFVQTSRQGVALALSSGLQASTALHLYKAGRTEEADTVLVNMRGIMDRVEEMAAAQPAMAGTVREVAGQGAVSESSLAQGLAEAGGLRGGDWDRRQLQARLRAERWSFKRARMTPPDPFQRPMRTSVRWERPLIASLQKNLGDGEGAAISYAAAMVAGCAGSAYPAVERTAAARAAVRACISDDPVFSFSIPAMSSSDGWMTTSAVESWATVGEPYLDRVIDHLDATVDQAAPPQ